MIGKRDARLKQNREKGEISKREKEKKDGPDIVREMYGLLAYHHSRRETQTNPAVSPAPR